MTSLTGRNWMTDAGPLYGHEEAFQNGRAVGNVAGFAVDAVLTVSGISGVVTGVRAIQSAGGLLQVAQLLTDAGQTINVVVQNGRVVVATAETLASLGVSAAAAANLMAAANNAGQSGGSNSPKFDYTNLPEKVQSQIARNGLPTSGETPFVPKLVKNKRGDLEIVKTEITQGPKAGKKGYVDSEGRIWIRDSAHANYPDHWDVQLDGGKDYVRVGLDGNKVTKIK